MDSSGAVLYKGMMILYKNIYTIGILKKLAHDDGYCVIVVTHDLGISADADEVLNMRDGKLII